MSLLLLTVDNGPGCKCLQWVESVSIPLARANGGDSPVPFQSPRDSADTGDVGHQGDGLRDDPILARCNPIWLFFASFFFQSRISPVMLRATRLFPIVRSPRFRSPIGASRASGAWRIGEEGPPRFRVTFVTFVTFATVVTFRVTFGPPRASLAIPASASTSALSPWRVRTLGPFGHVAASRTRCRCGDPRDATPGSRQSSTSSTCFRATPPRRGCIPDVGIRARRMAFWAATSQGRRGAQPR
jgi:hypothetical protein